MAISTKRITLDGSGNGKVQVTPSWYVGALGCTGCTNHGNDLGVAFLTRANSKFVTGEIDVTGGTPSGEAQVFVDIC